MGIPSPRHVFVPDVATAEAEAERLRYPLFVKPLSGGQRPRVHTPVEVHFPANESFKHFDKWTDYQGLDSRAVTDEALTLFVFEFARRCTGRRVTVNGMHSESLRRAGLTQETPVFFNRHATGTAPRNKELPIA